MVAISSETGERKEKERATFCVCGEEDDGKRELGMASGFDGEGVSPAVEKMKWRRG